DRRPLHALRADRMRIVGNGDAWRKEDVVFDRRVLRDVDVAMDPHAVADDTAVVDRRVVPERAVVADPIFFANDGVVARLEPIADDRSGVDDRAGAHARLDADLQRRERAVPARRVVEDRAGVDLAHRLTAVPHCRIDASMATSVLITPMLNALLATGRRPVRMAATKSAH